MNDFLNNFHFLRPAFLLAIIPAIVIILLLLKQQLRARQWQTFIAPHLIPFLVDGEANKIKRAPLFMLLVLWTLTTIALSGPAWKKLPQPVHKQADALVILWDLSPSMRATDLSPSRFGRARLKLIDLLRNRQEGVTALIAYAGEAHVVTPLTDDTATIISLLSGLNPNIMPVSGSNPEMALETATQLLKDGSIAKGDILFITDGIAESAFNELAGLAKNSGHRISVWGIGTPEGAPIPGKTSGFIKNSQGEIIISKLNEKQLSEAASAMGGVYIPFTNNDFDSKTFAALTKTQAGTVNRETQRSFDKWFEHGPYLLLLVLPFAALAFRRGWLLTIALVFFFPSENSYALNWNDLWATKDQQAQRQLQAGDTESAANNFSNEHWKGIAQYKNKDYESALKTFEQSSSAESLFNQGNALTQMGDYEKAKSAYKKALEKNPNLSQAKQNLAIAEQLEELEKQQQSQDSQSGEQGEDGENSPEQSQQDQQQNQNAEDNQQANQNQQSEGDSSDNSDQSENQDQNAAKNSEQLSQDQQQALENQYGEDSEKPSPEESEEQSIAESEEAEDEQNTEEANEAQVAEQEDANGEELQNQNSVAMAQDAPEQTEEQQALEQWLRKVPDDPSGLLRNKFRHESRERRLEARSGRLRSPTPSEERL